MPTDRVLLDACFLEFFVPTAATGRTARAARRGLAGPRSAKRCGGPSAVC